MDLEKIESLLNEIKSIEGVETTTLISRSGMHISGEVPKKAHLETFVAMSAILVGAAETSTNELDEAFGFITIELDESKLLLHSISTKSLIVIKVIKDFPLDEHRDFLTNKFDDIEDFM